MNNTTSILVSLFSGIILGSAAVCIIRKHGCKIDKGDIHKKIMDELEQLRSYIAAHHPEEICSCEDPACNCKEE